MKKHSAGFTLVEIIVVVAIIGILSAVIYANFNQGGAQARDAQRKADLVTLQNAIELYKNDNGRYPAGCNGAGNWSAQSSATAFDCPAGQQYIEGHTAGITFAPKYIKVLPTDPRPAASESNGSGSDVAHSGYMYITNAEGTVYKLMARNTVETELLNYDSDFKACDVVEDLNNVDGDNNSMTVDCGLTDIPQEGSWCGMGSCNIYFNNPGYSRPATGCNQVGIRYSYAVKGGYADPEDVGGAVNDALKVERGTEQIVCDMPTL